MHSDLSILKSQLMKASGMGRKDFDPGEHTPLDTGNHM